MYIFILTIPQRLQGVCLGMGVPFAHLFERKLFQPKDHFLGQFVMTEGSVFA